MSCTVVRYRESGNCVRYSAVFVNLGKLWSISYEVLYGGFDKTTEDSEKILFENSIDRVVGKQAKLVTNCRISVRYYAT